MKVGHDRTRRATVVGARRRSSVMARRSVGRKKMTTMKWIEFGEESCHRCEEEPGGKVEKRGRKSSAGARRSTGEKENGGPRVLRQPKV